MQAANLPSESAKAEADMVTDGVVPPDTTPLMVNLGPLASSGGDVVMVEASAATPQPRADTEDVAYLLPSSSVVETAKDKAMAVVTTPLPDPR